MKPIYIVLAGMLAAFTACNNNAGSRHSTTTDTANAQPKVATPTAQSKLNSEGTGMLVTVVSKYYALKNALVATKAGRADSAAMQLEQAANDMQAFLQKDSANGTALKAYVDTVVTQSKIITTITDESCEKQRLAFGTISSAIYGMLKKADMKNAGIYHAYCPMAFNEKGAFWLSEESDIKNPYFGKKMLECGEVTDSL